jgi:hypothetical protein
VKGFLGNHRRLQHRWQLAIARQLVEQHRGNG